MTIKIVENVSEKKLSAFFLSDPKLAYQGLCDEKLLSLYEKKQYIKDTNCKYFGIIEEVNNELICIVKMEQYSLLAASVHFYVLTKCQRRQYSLQIKDLMIKWLLDNTKTIIRCIMVVPSTCLHVQSFMKAIGAELEGKVKRCLIWRKELVDLYYYGLDIREFNKWLM